MRQIALFVAWLVVLVAVTGCKPQTPSGGAGKSGSTAPTTTDGNTTSR